MHGWPAVAWDHGPGQGYEGGNPAVIRTERSNIMSLADLCLVLGALFAFATLVVKVIEVSRK